MPDSNLPERSTNLRPVHVLLFDIDGTLIHAGGAGRGALLAALGAEFAITEPRLDVDFAGRTDRSIASDALLQNGLAAEEATFARYLASYLRHLPESLSSQRGRVLPGVTELLAALAARKDVILGVLTGNFERAAAMKLAHYGLDAYFPLGGYGDLHFDRDDVAREAHRAVRFHCGEEHASAQIWVIGDTPLDVRCARAIGARAIAVGSGFATREELAAAEPDHLFEDLTDLRAFLALLDAP